jgi:glycosyltransferase involved in cell wall biosynthesis
MLDMYSADYIIYDYLDDFSAWRPYHRPMVNRAHLVITTSGILQSQMQAEFPGKTSVLVPNGCDISHFRPNASRKRPAEFLHHNGPIITYTGAWATWIDQELVNKIAMTFKQAMVAIIGTEFGSAVNRSIPNLRYLGYKPYQELPSYLQHSTVCIIPFLIGQVTNATNPVKMYEYLASGKPVVSTNIPEARNIPSVHIGSDHALFIEKIRLIMERQILFNEVDVNNWLASHTWEKRFETIFTLLSERGLT